ncbi:MAG: hybrid sensor histidine kinase/response regulator [Oscillatoriales cyanobacterium]|jgi:CheY-like chemotaxis protein|uniref:response regulator n=2 Tax=unclassified Microcoleus TaxID=2642155 RepID=UPI001DB456F1|nr:response regulator [Microcoleus sp. PH2017_05_CCC_O_A]TAG05851.1 MAG: hybrid sensor histidine kinase/response regulator [Oscillatoriales cyanobacterium]MCC3437922.1 response regulator [Microcoleus sp. PH2017_05_CCC_O_A]TAG13971.1 MAG: hybrid sensor histidine kinase/response regulator [Oscillatoriales cyanobacterium]TAG43069.1 MAG: hybrid sensor histidine kinase/response regulator [Oscillatoriales cyanobacterium]TAG59265.1 MAG: hybrid sensor histidine kinase/response regulator [Oscillatorial
MTTNKTENNKGNILIVDDTPENLQVLSATLSDRGYKVRGVINGKMAIRAARSGSPDLILLDIKMPEMDGYEVCTQLKVDPKTSEIPVIFISALDEVLDKVTAFKVGGVDFITKPFHVAEVLARIEHQLTIQRLKKQLIDRNTELQQEIIERKKAEEAAAAASLAKSQFVANMSHELRTPLNAILGFTQVMSRDSLLSHENIENLRIINRSGQHLLELINDVLDLSKIEAGIIGLDERSFDLYQLLDTLEEMFQIKAETKNLQLRFSVQPNVPQYIKTDEKKLRVCLINLLGNALKFTPNCGSIWLRAVQANHQPAKSEVYPNSTSDDCYFILFEVEDTGVGIATAEIDKLFEAFVQTEAGKQAADGTGLGLTITKKYVEIMGGDIEVESVLGEGTIFKFNIRVFPATSSEITVATSQRAIALQPDQPIYRILAVDDNQENRLLLVKMLQPIGFEVREAENGFQALELWESWHPDLIWLDTRMPVMDGFEAVRQIRAKEKPSERRTVIIALTASTFEEKKGEILAAGCDDFVRKPFQEQMLFDKIASYLGVRYIYQELPALPVGALRRYFVSEKPDSFFSPLLAQMPRSWVQELYDAVNDVDEELAIQIVDRISETHPTLAEALKDLLADYRLDRIMDLTQSILK